MTDIDRQELRELQNKVIADLLRRGYTESDKLGIYDANQKNLTIKELRQYIYPTMRQDFINYLSED